MSNKTITRRGAFRAQQLLDKEDVVALFIDHQAMFAVGLGSHDRTRITNNWNALAKTARLFDLPVVMTTNGSAITGDVIKEIRSILPDVEVIDRTVLNAWEDERIVKAVEETGREKLLVAGLWTEICVAFPVLSALEAGYEVYIVADGSGGGTPETHEVALQRLIQAGAIPVTWQQAASELFGDFSDRTHYDEFVELMRQHDGAFGHVLDYAFSHVVPHLEQTGESQ